MSSASPDPGRTRGTSTTASRQQPGLACEQCRARKLRCDRKQPQCGGCKDIGVQCTPTVRQPRGPKKGHLKAMQSRLSALEGLLNGVTNSETCVQPISLQNLASPTSASQTNDILANSTYGEIEEPVTYPETQIPQSLPIDSNDRHYMQWKPVAEVHPAVELMDMGADLPLPDWDQVTLPDCFSYNFGSDFAQAKMGPPGSQNLQSVPSILSEPSVRSPITSQASSWQSYPSLPVTPPSTDVTQLSTLEKADLNHLYFDRIYASVPLLNQRRYFARTSRPDIPESVKCLQHAMWTLAASISSQFQHIQTALYSQTRKMLEALELDTNSETMAVEQAQSWALLTIYEITQVNFQRGWLSAGRCFRLVQLNKLHMLDCPQHDTNRIDLSWVELEEQRRTFWIAYSLDRSINLMNQLPLMLTEQVMTRLPAPEAAFQSGQPVETAFLSHFMTGSGEHASSPFTDSIVLLTIGGRCLSHQQSSSVQRLQGNVAEEFWRRHQWLESTLSSQITTMLAQTEDESKPTDSMSLFTIMTAHATALSLWIALQSRKRDLDGFEKAMRSCEARTSASAHQIVNLSQKLAELSLYKVHPLTPIPLLLCAEFARGRTTNPNFQCVYQTMCNTLRELSPINRLAQVCLRKLEHAGEETSIID